MYIYNMYSYLCIYNLYTLVHIYYIYIYIMLSVSPVRLTPNAVGKKTAIVSDRNF